MLDQHFIDGRPADVGIEGRLAQGEEVIEGGLKAFVAAMGRFQDFEQSLGQLRDLGLKLVHRLPEVVDLRLGVGEELVQDGGQIFRFGQVEPFALLAALIEHGSIGVLKNGVGERVAFVDFLLNFRVEVVAQVLGFPEAAAHVEEITEGAVGEDSVFADFEFLFGNEFPAVGLGGFFEQALEGGFEGAFVDHAVVAVTLQGGVVFLEGLVSRLDTRGFGHRH